MCMLTARGLCSPGLHRISPLSDSPCLTSRHSLRYSTVCFQCVGVAAGPVEKNTGLLHLCSNRMSKYETTDPTLASLVKSRWNGEEKVASPGRSVCMSMVCKFT